MFQIRTKQTLVVINVMDMIRFYFLAIDFFSFLPTCSIPLSPCECFRDNFAAYHLHIPHVCASIKQGCAIKEFNHQKLTIWYTNAKRYDC